MALLKISLGNVLGNTLENLVDVALDANIISLNLGQNVTAGSGNITLTDGDGEVISIAVNDTTQVSILGDLVTINLNVDLLPGTTYTLEIADGAFLDTSGSEINNILSGLADNTFTTVADTIAPDIVGNISILDAGISFNLGEAVTAVSGKNITLTPDSGSAITIAADDTTQVSILGGVVTIKASNLFPGTEYTVAIDSGAFVDLGGNPFDGVLADDGTFNFTTANDSTGTISISILDNANISLNLDQAVTAGSGNITLTPNGGGDVITIAANDTTQVSILDDLVIINPNVDLLPNTTYTVAIDSNALLDGTGGLINDVLNGLTDSTFTTLVDDIAPDIVGNISISDGAIDVAVDTGISFDLGETVEAVAGKTITLTPDGGGEIISIDADDTTQVSILDGLVTINPNVDLLPDTGYTLAIDSGAFIDRAENEFDGTLADDGTFNFTTVAADDNNGGNTTIMPINTTNSDANGNVMEVIDLTQFMGQTVTGSFEIDREADYNNNVYFYKIDNNNGDIGSLTPDTSGYLQTALNNVINPTQALTTTDETTTTTTFDIAGGSILGIVMVADGTLEQAQSNLDSVKGVYFSFLGANTDNGTFDHIRLNGNTFEFEDLANGGDSDFNDFEINMDFTV